MCIGNKVTLITDKLNIKVYMTQSIIIKYNFALTNMQIIFVLDWDVLFQIYHFVYVDIIKARILYIC